MALLIVALVTLLLLANVLGNSATATKLATKRNIKLQGAVSGNADFDGSENVTINTTLTNTTVLTGTIELTANTQENLQKSPLKAIMSSKTLNFPTGFNKDNTIVIFVGFRKTSDKGYAYGWNNYADSSDFVRGTMPYNIIIGPNNITVRLGNFSSDATNYEYKIVLMKI